jgi:septin family protein
VLRELFLNHKINGQNTSTNECPPFAIINPDDKLIITSQSGKMKIYYGRKYPWGFVDAFNEDYSDFGRLYKLIISNSYLF